MELTEKEETFEIKAECTWGDGPDVLISIKNFPMILASDVIDKQRFKHGIVKDAWIDLTQEQARQLAHKLLKAANCAQELEDGLREI